MMTLRKVAALLFLLPLCLSAADIRVNGQVRVDPASSEKHPSVSDSANVVIWLTAVSGGQPVPVATHPQQSLRMVQRDKRFVPGLLVVPVGSRVEFPNEDPFFHNVFSLYQGKRFDLQLYEAGEKRTVSFDKPGISYIFCNIHPEMKAVVVALATPYYAVTDSSGKFAINGVPPGKYRMQVWYERALPETLQSLSRTLEIARDNETVDTIHFQQAPGAHDHHHNKFGQEYEHPTERPY